MSTEIFAMRKSKHGFIYFVCAIVGVLIILFGILANSAINQRYGINIKDPIDVYQSRKFGDIVNSYKN